MISTTPTDAERATYVQNIIDTYNRATDRQYEEGARWYPMAHQLAYMISDGNVREGAGVIAALSANKSWSENTKIATRALGSGKATGHVKDALTKATKIMNGADPEDVLPMGAKTGNFFLCINDPSNGTAVCVDRHAHDIAVGEVYGNRDRGLSTKSRYNVIADAYRAAADRAGELPLVMQAVTWVVQTEELRGLSTRGNNH